MLNMASKYISKYVLLSHSSAPVYPSVAHCGFFARPGPSTDSDATGLLQRTPRWGTKVSPQPVVSRPAGCSSFDSAASSHQQCRKRDSHRAALAGCSCEGDFQAVLARSSVSSWVGSALPDPVLHTSQLYRRTLSSPFGRHGHGVCAWIADVDNWTSGVRRTSPLRLHGTVSRLIFAIPGSVFWLSDVDSKLICLILPVIYLSSPIITLNK